MIEVRIKKDVGSFQLDVEFHAGNKVLALLGGSGSGKSMTLRAIAGIMTPDEGRIVVDDTVYFDSERHINLPPQKRRAGLLFQNYALFPTMTVLENIMMGIRTGSRRERRQAAMEAAERFKLAGLEDRLPGQLSGGQQQRVALTRILVGQPMLLMLDEPFSALDSYLRDQMEREVLNVIRAYGGTTILVSHNRDEVFRMADCVAVYAEGRVDAMDKKHELFQNPRTYTSALLTGCKNFSKITCRPSDEDATYIYADEWGMDFVLTGKRDGDIVAIRGHYLKLAPRPGKNIFLMETVHVIEDTFEYVLCIRRKGTDSKPIYWMMAKEEYRDLPAGELLVEFPAEQLMVLRA